MKHTPAIDLPEPADVFSRWAEKGGRLWRGAIAAALRGIVPCGIVFLLALAALVSGCARQNPQAALDAAADALAAALEARDAKGTLDLLAPEFAIRSVPEDGKEWAQQTMTRLFLRYRNVKIVATNRQNHIDPRQPDRAVSTADVTLLGAEGLLPNNVSRYHVELGWTMVEGKWKLLHLQWE
ncbi:MAG: hypothetical protein LBO00_06135 [Zoogloeaceae bacterium]|nr:hypothetical protein [Zoogloeaceae bacterium]